MGDNFLVLLPTTRADPSKTSTLRYSVIHPQESESLSLGLVTFSCTEKI